MLQESIVSVSVVVCGSWFIEEVDESVTQKSPMMRAKTHVECAISNCSVGNLFGEIWKFPHLKDQTM